MLERGDSEGGGNGGAAATVVSSLSIAELSKAIITLLFQVFDVAASKIIRPIEKSRSPKKKKKITKDLPH